MSEVKPYAFSEDGKKEQVRRMFDGIAPAYDLLNHLLSAGRDRRWRKRTIERLGALSGAEVLDVATGTGDLALAAARADSSCKVVGLDIAPKMLEKARSKSAEKGLAARMSFDVGDSENLPYESNRFDRVTVAFGVRNFEDLKAGLAEMHRVLKPGGKVAVLEFTRPKMFPIKQLFGFYFKNVLPLIGGMRSGDRQAYKYLYESVQAFPEYGDFATILEDVGFRNASYEALSAGICAVYTAEK